jgi:hypothetical protein
MNFYSYSRLIDLLDPIMASYLSLLTCIKEVPALNLSAIPPTISYKDLVFPSTAWLIMVILYFGK